jgi:hypothetical protein
MAEEPIVDQLMRRLDVLEADKRRWKTIAVVMTLLLVLMMVVGVVVIGLGSWLYLGPLPRGLEEIERARMERYQMEAARQQVERERMLLMQERDKLEVEKAELKKAR